jgi:hypothetical protein
MKLVIYYFGNASMLFHILSLFDYKLKINLISIIYGIQVLMTTLFVYVIEKQWFISVLWYMGTDDH